MKQAGRAGMTYFLFIAPFMDDLFVIIKHFFIFVQLFLYISDTFFFWKLISYSSS